VCETIFDRIERDTLARRSAYNNLEEGNAETSDDDTAAALHHWLSRSVSDDEKRKDVERRNDEFEYNNTKKHVRWWRNGVEFK